jgi:hypothetical protein
VNPVIALALGWRVGDDHITNRVPIAAALVIVAVVPTRPSSGHHRGDGQ